MIGIAFTYDSSLRNVCSGSGFAIDMMRGCARAFGMTDMIICDYDRLIPPLGDSSINSCLCDELNQLQEKYQDWTKVVLDLESNLIRKSKPYELLHDFQHPAEPVLYIVGSDALGFTDEERDVGDYFVAIDQPGTTQLWSVAALSIALYDRYIKRT